MPRDGTSRRSTTTRRWIIGVSSVDGLEVKFERGIEYIMCESTSAFFEAY